jgi:polar amino acid transport system substrate-binding protein
LRKLAIARGFMVYEGLRGSAGLDLKPQGYDIDMANLIGKEARREGRDHAGDQRQPHSLPADQEGRPRDLQPRQEPGAREGHRLLDRLCAVLPGVFGTKDRWSCQAPADLRQDHRRHPRRHRGPGADQDRAAGATIKRFEDNNATIAAFVSGQVHLIATGARWPATSPKKVPPARRAQIRDQGQPCFIGLNKGEPSCAKVNEIIAKAKASGDIEQAVGEVARPPAGLPPGF